MRHVALSAAAAILTLALASCGGGGASSAPVAPPTASTGVGGPAPLNTLPEVDSVNGVATVSLIAKFDANSRPAFYWQGQEVAPTIRVHPGDTIQLSFQNSLPEYCDVLLPETRRTPV